MIEQDIGSLVHLGQRPHEEEPARARCTGDRARARTRGDEVS